MTNQAEAKAEESLPLEAAVAPQSTSHVLDPKDQLSILLEEYRTLRTELLERHASVLQIMGFTAAGFVATMGFTIAHKALIAGIFTFLALLCSIVVGLLLLDNDSRLLSTRLQQIEGEVNLRAGQNLLVWESTRGIEKIGYRERIRQTWRRWKP
jgi:hypothetical protein